MIRVLVVDDQPLVRAGLRMLCDATADLELTGEAASGAEGVRLARRLRPDVVLMDLRMPGMDGTTATQRILAERPSVPVVILTTFDDDDHLYPALAAGAAGFLAKDRPPPELVDAIRRAAQGEAVFSPVVLTRLVEAAVDSRRSGSEPDERQRAGVPAMTPRERAVLALVAEGLSNAEIAERMHVGVTTVKTHVASLMSKTDSPNRVRLAVYAVEHGGTALAGD